MLLQKDTGARVSEQPLHGAPSTGLWKRSLGEALSRAGSPEGAAFKLLWLQSTIKINLHCEEAHTQGHHIFMEIKMKVFVKQDSFLSSDNFDSFLLSDKKSWWPLAAQAWWLPTCPHCVS